jgi:hypothetical protein
MEKKMVYGLPNPFAHAAPINHDNMPLPKIVNGKNLSSNCRPSKKSHFHINLGPPNTLPEEKNVIFTIKDPIEGSNIKLPFMRRDPPNLVFPFPSHSMGIQQSIERSQDIHLSIVRYSNRANIPLKGTARKVQVSCKKRILLTSNAI